MTIESNHREAELERLEAGLEGCGCEWCQDFYKSIDLEKYGDRVKRYAGVVSVMAGKTGASKWDEYHRPDGWSPGGQVAIVDGKGYRVSATGRTYCVGQVDEKGATVDPAETVAGDGVQDTPENAQDGREPRTKIGAEGLRVVNHSQAQADIIVTPEKQGRGRPRKDNAEVCDRTLRRRAAEDRQGMLF